MNRETEEDIPFLVACCVELVFLPLLIIYYTLNPRTEILWEEWVYEEDEK